MNKRDNRFNTLNIIAAGIFIALLMLGIYKSGGPKELVLKNQLKYDIKTKEANLSNYINSRGTARKTEDRQNKEEENKHVTMLIPGGKTIGVRLYSDGIAAVGFSDIDTLNGNVKSPAEQADIKLGDSILEANGNLVSSSREFADLIKKSKGNSIRLKIKRDKSTIYRNIVPVKDKGRNIYCIGLWVRDSTAGVGTLTFVDPSSRRFGALGHPICDIDSGHIIPVKSGSILSTKIIAIDIGQRGKPGELKGVFNEEEELGKIMLNSNEGIYGEAGSILLNNHNEVLPAAERSEVHTGAAVIRASVDGVNVKDYSIRIERVFQQKEPDSKSMIIRVTDKELLSLTGGIVQGMSGSPILQEGKIVGAVTHVFVNKPDMGYGIYIDWMLEKSRF